VAVNRLGRASKQCGWQDKLLSVSMPVILLGCLAGARYFPAISDDWRTLGPFLLFFGVLTSVNAPFDWLSLGLTRLLLRRGIEQGGPWPYAYALIDALLASVLITLLALAMVSATDLFNSLAQLGGHGEARVLPPMQVYLAALQSTPQAHEYWWVFATLFSTMIPSVINLFIAGFSFLRGLPILRKWLLGVMRENEAMPSTDRMGAALILTAQGAFALLFAVAAQVFLTWGVLYHLMPGVGLGILDLAKKVAM
jgi:hypothetical protein